MVQKRLNANLNELYLFHGSNPAGVLGIGLGRLKKTGGILLVNDQPKKSQKSEGSTSPKGFFLFFFDRVPWGDFY